MTHFRYRIEYTENPPMWMISPFWPCKGWNAKSAYHYYLLPA